MKKDAIIKHYNLSKRQTHLIEQYIEKLGETNQKLNLVGSSTLNTPWDRHINDSLQLSKFILNKNLSIVDLGTGAGLPGLILSIYGHKNIMLVDSKFKKIKFIRDFADQNNIIIKSMCCRIENIKNHKFDYILCRAFAPLSKTLDYSLLFSKKNTSLLFLKGRNVRNEIEAAKKRFVFKYKLFESKSVGGGFVLNINKFTKI